MKGAWNGSTVTPLIPPWKLIPSTLSPNLSPPRVKSAYQGAVAPPTVPCGTGWQGNAGHCGPRGPDTMNERIGLEELRFAEHENTLQL